MRSRIMILVILAVCCISIWAFSIVTSSAGTKEKAIAEAIQQKNTPLLIKSLISHIKEELEIDYDRFPDLIMEVEKYTASCEDQAAAAILHSMTAEMYQQYYQQDQWRINRRTNLEDYTPEDIREWTANLFTAKVKEELDASLQPTALLQQTPVARYKDIMETGKDSPALRPTLYDFLIARALDVQPSDDYYNEWLAFRQTQPDQKAALLIELERLNHIYRAIHSVEAQKAYDVSLDSLLALYASQDYSIDIRIAKIELLDRKRHVFSNKDSVFAVQVAVCKEGIARFPSYPRTAELKNKLAGWEAPTIQTEVHSQAYPGETFPLELHYTNVSTVKVQLYESKRSLASVSDYYNPETKDKGARGKLVKEMFFTLRPSADLMQKDTILRFPAGANGLYECVVSVPEKNVIVSHWVSVSRLTTIYRINNSQAEVLVADYKSGKPVSGATVIWYDRSGRDNKVLGSKQTDKDGLMVLSSSDRHIAFRAVTPGDTASRYASAFLSENYPSYGNELSLTLFTDRGIYRPGQTVFFKAIVYHPNDEKPYVAANQPYSVVFRDANYKEIGTKQFRTNEFGSFEGSFALPQQALNGIFTLEAAGTSVYVRVEEYKRPTFEVEMPAVKDDVAFGDVVTIRGKAHTFSGVSLGDGAVSWRIVRSSLWMRGVLGRSIPVANGSTQVNSDGSFTFTFTPEKEQRLMTPAYYYYEIYAAVTDSKGETQEAQSMFSVGDAGFALSLNLPDIVEKDTASFIVSANTLNGEPVSVSGTYRIVTLTEATADPGRITSPRVEYAEGNMTTSGSFTTGNTFDRSFFSSLASGRYRIKLEARDSKGRPVTSDHDFILYDKNDRRPPVFSHFWVLKDKTTCLPGEEASFTVGTSDQDAYILYELFQSGKRISKERFRLSDENRHFSMPFSDTWGDGIVALFTFIKEGQMYDTQIPIARTQPDRKLTITPTTFRDKLSPGSKESWTFRVSDTDSTAVSAEVLAGMYDASLDKLMPASWTFAPERFINLSVPGFYTDMHPWSNGSAVGEIKTLPGGTYQFDRLNWQGVFNLNRVFPESQQFVTIGAPAMRMKSSATQADVANGFLKAGGVEVEEDIMMADQAVAEQPLAPLQLRQNFNETAFFYPQLRTNEAGDVLVTFTLPESNTRWKFQAIAHTKDLKYGQLTQEIVSSKPFMVVPNLPRFLREDDKVVLSTQLLNQLDKEITGKARLELFDPATDKLIAGLAQPEQAFTLSAKGSGTASWTVTVPKGASLIGCRIIAEGVDGSDGEQHLLPVLSNRILVTESTPIYMLNPGEKTIRIDQGKGSRQPFRLTVELTGNPVWYAVQALPTLTQPANDNILSWFAAYYSNSLATYLASAYPRVQRIINLWTAQGGDVSTLLSNLEKNEELKNIILEETPWVLAADKETEQKQRLSLLFDMNRVASGREAAWQRLVEQQTAEGGWSWFKGFLTDRAITLSIVKGMNQLVQLKAIQYNDQEKAIIERAVNYLDECLRKDFADLKKNNKQWQNAMPSPWQLTYMLVRSEYKGIPLADGTREAIRFYTTQAGKEWMTLSLAGKGEAALLLNRGGNKATATAILDWLRKTATTSEQQGMYWANNRRGSDFFTSPLEVHCQLMGVFNELAPDTKETDRMKQWLLNQKRTQNWESVPATVNAIYAIMQTGSNWLQQDNSITAKWGSKTMRTDEGEAATGYVKEAISEKEITSSMYTLTVHKQGEAPAWGAIYNQYFESLDKVDAHKGVLNVEKKLFVETSNGIGQQLSQVTANHPLRVGDKVIVRLTIRTDRDMEYVSLKDLRAGCFEPAALLSGYNYRDGVGFYRSPKDVSENFFFTRLPRGTFVIEYPVYVSRKGDYAGGVSTIQCMYAPEFVSHTDGERLQVND